MKGGIGFPGLLALIFITLKLLDKIDWSWLWVLSPLWIPLGIGFAFLVICLLVCIPFWAYAFFKSERRYKNAGGK